MKRIFSFVLSALLAIVFTTANAQQNIFIWKGGNITVKSAADIDSISTSVGWLFDIRTSAATSVTTNTLEASISVSCADNVKSLSKTPEVGVCFSSETASPNCTGECKRLGSSVGSYSFTLYELDQGTTYYYRGYVKLGDEVLYGNVKSITTFGDKPSSPTYTLINGHKFVDLGLASGLLWACTNVSAASFSDDGDYFAWGETKSKSRYSLGTYKWNNKPDDNVLWITKYNAADGKTTLDANDDAATVNWGSPCRMPDISEFEELYNQCVWSWMSNYNGTSGTLSQVPMVTPSSSLLRVTTGAMTSAAMVRVVTIGLVRSTRTRTTPSNPLTTSASAETTSTRRGTKCFVMLGTLSAQSQKNKVG